MNTSHYLELVAATSRTVVSFTVDNESCTMVKSTYDLVDSSLLKEHTRTHGLVTSRMFYKAFKSKGYTAKQYSFTVIAN